MRPIPVIDKFILGQAIIRHFCSYRFRNSRIMGKKVHQPLLVGFVFPDDFFSSFIACLREIIILSNVIGAERSVIIRVGLQIGDGIILVKSLFPSRRIDSGKQFVTGRIVSLRFGKWYPVGRISAQGHSEIIRL